MGKGSTTSEVQHFRTLEDGRIGCRAGSCDEPATRWIDMERYGIKRWLSTAYCDDHGGWEFEDSRHTHRERKIKDNR
ncbi:MULTISPECIES: hypothetical protein [Streptomyces]|uniref:hypothetical protein n=1 Tax=Streptomyces TaxID=1883 RepID=UPI001E414F14|nr:MULTISPECIES: hypothetical protein [Streptomyces]UFQ16440.1 hypothetical protein J2N69_16305 [Streptomyces huasconensis]WCL86042.1 hypothetical protein PPN52_16315 [Streptomyces sp. JCM 35825]